jgi:hypothetical protein
MNATYRFTPDVRYYFASRRRFERQRPLLLRQPVGSLLSVLPILILWFVLWLVNPELERAVRYLFAFGFAIYAVALVAMQGFLYWRVKANESKFTEMTLTLSEDGVSVSDAITQSKIAWEAYPRAVRFHDGMMLLRTRFHRIWLPDSALQGATPQEVAELVRSRVPLQHVA